MDAYIYCADLWCEDCTREIILEHYQRDESIAREDISTSDLLAEWLKSEGHGDGIYDSDDYPKGPFDNGGGEADTPQHCRVCHCFLENPLTQDGYDYVLDALRDGSGDAEILKQWKDYYGDDYIPGKPNTSINEILLREAGEALDEKAKPALKELMAVLDMWYGSRSGWRDYELPPEMDVQFANPAHVDHFLRALTK